MPQTINIIHVLRAPVGGLFRHVADLAAMQAARGLGIGIVYDRSTVSPAALERLAELAPVASLGLLPIDMSREISFRDVTGYLEIARFAKRAGAAVLHGHGAKGGAFARLAARACRSAGLDTVAYYTPHGGSLHYDASSFKGRIFLALERKLLPMTSGVIFESAFSSRAFEQKIGRPMRSRIVHNGLADAEFRPVAPRSSAADFVFVGELRRLKGVDVLIEALATLDKSRRATLAIVGAGPDAEAFKSLAAERGLADRVRFHGPIAARQAFELGRVLVVPSRAESLPYIVLEAAAAEVPLVATDVGGIPEIVEGTQVRLVPPDDVAALAARLALALDEPAVLAGASRGLRRRVAERFNVGRMCEEVTAFYHAAEANTEGLRYAAH